FFFSSRRRHTRSDRDWSSDVCSSDLTRNHYVSGQGEIGLRVKLGERLGIGAKNELTGVLQQQRDANGGDEHRECGAIAQRAVSEIGRASCREGVERGVGEVGVEQERE